MKLFRKTFFWLHLVVGLLVGLGVAVMAATGLLLAFEHPIVDRLERADGRPPAGVAATPGNARTVESLLTSATAAVPDATPTALTAWSDLTRPAAVQFGKGQAVYLNNFTGRVVGTGAPRARAFFQTVEGLHRWLALGGTGRDWGKAWTGAVDLGFLVLIVSGLWLWVPRTFRWRAVRPVLVPGVRLRGKARDWNWHNVAGIWLLVPLLVVTLTGTVMAYPWATSLLYRAVGETPPAPRGERAGTDGRRRPGGGDRRRPPDLDGLDDLWAAAVRRADPGWTSMTLQLGGGRGGVTVAVAYGEPNLPTNRVALTFDRRSDDLTQTERFADGTLGRRLRALVVPIHRGEVLGNAGRAVAAAACVAALVLVYTGFALAWRRLGRLWGHRQARASPFTDRAVVEAR